MKYIDWTIFTAISTAAGAVASSFAAGVALWIACTEQKRLDVYKKKVIKSQKCDLILVPTKEWDLGDKYQMLIGELNGMNVTNNAAKYISEYRANKSPIEIDNHVIDDILKQADLLRENCIEEKWLDGSIILISPSDLFWIDSQRIYGVNIKTNKSVVAARRYLMTTPYFKDAFITTCGENHDKKFNSNN